MQQEYIRAETCYVGTTDGDIGWRETAVIVGPKRRVKDTVQWRRSSMSNNDQGSQGCGSGRGTLLTGYFISECWTLKMKALHTFKTLQTLCSTRQVTCQQTWTCSTPLWETQISRHTVSWARPALLNPLYLPHPSVSNQTSMYSLYWQTKKFYKKSCPQGSPGPINPHLTMFKIYLRYTFTWSHMLPKEYAHIPLTSADLSKHML